MLDFVFVAIFGIVIALTVSLFLVRVKKNYRRHKQFQITLAIILLITLVAFEIDIRFFSNWRSLAEPSAFYESGWVDRILWIHLCFAIPTPFAWAYTVIMALRSFPKDPQPSAYSRKHVFWGRLSAGLMYATAVTGCVFYVISFVM